MIGIRTKQTIDGTVREEIEGDYAGSLIKIHTTNPYGEPVGTIRHTYQVNTADGLIPARVGDLQCNIMDADLVAGEFAGLSYLQIMAGVKAVCKFLAERTEANAGADN